MSIQMREARFQDYKGIAALEVSQGLAAKPEVEWRRLWTGNPAYEEIGPQWPIGWVLDQDERIVGCLMNIPIHYFLKGRKLTVACGRGWAVDDQYRGYALQLMNEYFSQEKVDLFLSNTVNGNAEAAHRAFGELQVPAGQWNVSCLAITEHRGFAESALRIKQVPMAGPLSYAVGLGLRIKDAFTAKPIPRSDIPVTLGRDFDQRFDTFWEILSQRSDALLALRSREALKWHFSSSIDAGGLWVLTASHNNNLEAYAVFQRRDEPKYGLKRMRMVDFQSLDWQDQFCAAFMRRAHQECQKQGISVLENVGCGIKKTRIFDECAPYRRPLPSWSFFYQAKDPGLAAELERPEAWDPSSYDADASL